MSAGGPWVGAVMIWVLEEGTEVENPDLASFHDQGKKRRKLKDGHKKNRDSSKLEFH